MWYVKDLDNLWSWFEGMSEKNFREKIVAEAETHFGEKIDMILLRDGAEVSNQRLLHYEFYYSKC